MLSYERMIPMHTSGCWWMNSRRGLAHALVLVLFIPAVLSAQFGDRSSSSSSSGDRPSSRPTLPDVMQLKKDAETRIAAPPMDGPVDPTQYVVGPGDIFTVGVWGPVMFQLPLAVSPEGSLIIPSVGEIPVAGKTLASVKADVVKRVRARYTMGDITATLTAPRSFIVSLRGSVLAPGTYTATAVDRVEKVVRTGSTVATPTPTVSLIGQSMLDRHPDDEIAIPKVEQTITLYEKASTRNILLVRRTKDTVRVDLAKYEVTGDDRYNPYLRDGDMVVVPQRNIEHNFVSVQGAINSPGRYEFVEGDRLSDIIAIAHGTQPDATGFATISRLSEDGIVRGEQRVDITAIRAGSTADVLLERGDRIVIERAVDQRGDYAVTIRGEVAVPGIYPISRTGTTLQSALQSAGGLTEHALPAGSIVLRKFDRLGRDVTARYEMVRNWRTAQFSLVDSMYYLQVLREGRVPVQVNMARMIAGDASQNIQLEDGDIIFIARNRNTVLVDGQVAYPGYQPWQPGADLEHYLNAAGGPTEWAIEGDIRIIKSGSLAWMEPDETTIESGDQIWIPKKTPKDLLYVLTIFRDVATFLTALATVGILIYQIQSK